MSDDHQTRHHNSTELAEVRTYLAAERTLFAVIRTGLSIAGGGSLVTTLLGDEWPAWVQVPLVTAFLITGYTIALLGLRRYRTVTTTLQRASESGADMIPARRVTVLLVVLQIAIVVVVILFLVGAFDAGS